MSEEKTEAPEPLSQEEAARHLNAGEFLGPRCGGPDTWPIYRWFDEIAAWRSTCDGCGGTFITKQWWRRKTCGDACRCAVRTGGARVEAEDRLPPEPILVRCRHVVGWLHRCARCRGLFGSPRRRTSLCSPRCHSAAARDRERESRRRRSEARTSGERP